MIREHDRVVLTAPLREEGLEPGDIGAVVHVYPRHQAYEVEFVTLTGKTAAVVTIASPRPRSGHESEASVPRTIKPTRRFVKYSIAPAHLVAVRG